MARGLIVDDSKFMRRVLSDTLVEGGHEVIAEADNGDDALEIYKTKKPDFVTMDITIFGKDGIEAVQEIKKIDPGSKIIVVSALSEKTLKLNDKNLNADAYLTKPFEKADLLSLLEKLL
ncbi:MAG TPA: response regulator [Spirochaetota bacterium]|nr:response regulator [Spirochaetota bacterium]HPJ36961.1 response regulator [Spirochaetota bacterium]HPQ51630.1 response regulator [Spirochaetota bacterium]